MVSFFVCEILFLSFILEIRINRYTCSGETNYIKQNSTFTKLKPLFTTVLFAMLASYSSMASASLSSTSATPNQIKIVAKAATADQIKAQFAYKASSKTKSSATDNPSTNLATQRVNKIISQGVTTSLLSERYWARNYTQSRRVM